MAARFIVLASGSSGNAGLVEADGFRLLIDCGLRPPDLADRLGRVGVRLDAISAVVLTHTHGDHWNPHTFAALRQASVPVYAHPRHHARLASSPSFDPLHKAGLIRDYQAGLPIRLGPAMRATPVPVPHDSDPTFGFRVEGTDARTGGTWSLGYASDCGHPDPAVIAGFAGVGVLAIEFNHDVELQRTSGRHPVLVDRVLGPRGHLSNAQAATLTEAVARSAGPDGFTALVQLHLSKDCNTAALAHRAGTAALARVAPAARVVTATQFAPTPPVPLVGLVKPIRAVQLTLPGFDVAEADQFR